MNMKHLLTVGVAACALCALATPKVKPQTFAFTQDEATRLVTLAYELSEPAVVTVDIQTNGVSMGAAFREGLAGDYNALFGAGPHAITFDPLTNASFQAIGKVVSNVTAVLTAWATNAPPPWMVVDLDTPSNVTYYADESWFPLPMTSDVYKTDKLVMRRIPAANKTYRLGAPYNSNSSEKGKSWNPLSTARPVILTKDYYIGIYPVTQAQYRKIHGSLPPSAFWTDQTDSGLRPVGNLSYSRIRGTGTDYCWPSNGHNVASGTFMDELRKHSGVVFDLPTDAQWEIACRAGNGAAFNNGCNDWEDDASVGTIAWYTKNSSAQTHPVGMKEPNAWGLYDMHGNVWECVLDLYPAYNGAYAKSSALEIDPVGTTESDNGNSDGSERGLQRGGSYAEAANALRSARRQYYPRWTPSQDQGFRLCCPAMAY